MNDFSPEMQFFTFQDFFFIKKLIFSTLQVELQHKWEYSIENCLEKLNYLRRELSQ